MSRAGRPASPAAIRRRVFLRAAWMAAGAVLVAGCQPGPGAGPPPGTAAAPPAAPAVLAAPSPVATAGHLTREQIIQALRPFNGTTIAAAIVGSSPPPRSQVEALSAAGIQTEFTAIPATDLFQKLVVEFAAGQSSFDVVTFIPNQVGAFSQFMLDLKDLNAQYHWPEDDVLDAFRFYGWYPDRHSGAQFGLPYGGDVFMLNYRTDVFRMAGLDPNKAPQTYDELRQAASKTHNLTVDGTQVAGFIPRTSRALNHTWWANFFAAWGGDWFTADWQPRINTQPAVDALQYAVDLLQYGPPDATNIGFADVNKLWLAGSGAMTMHYQVTTTNAQFAKESRVVDRTAVAELPAGPAGRRCAMIGGQVLGVPARSGHAEAAYLWARYMLQPDNQLETALAGTGVEPFWRSLFMDPRLQQGFLDGKAGWQQEINQTSDRTLTLPNIPEWPQLQ
jgi:ABC-type glycerol-3-phosphate transport system substrate-binding protein